MLLVLLVVVLVAVGAAAAVAIDRALLRRWIRSQSLAGTSQRSTSSPSSKGPRTADQRQRVSARKELLATWKRLKAAETQRQEAQQAARRAESCLDALRSGLVLCDRKGRVVARNQAANVFVQTRYGEAMVAKTIDDLLRRARSGERVSAVVDLRAGSRRSYEVEARPVERDGETLGAVALVHDTTELLRTESIRRDFIANVSHELKTPIGALSLLVDSLETSNEPQMRERLTQRMQVEVRRVADTIDDLLTLARLEDHHGLRVEEVAVCDIVQGAVDRISETAQLHDVKVTVSGIAIASLVCGSRFELESAVFNLLDNAVKYSPRDSIVNVNIRKQDGELLIAVSDRGIGIPASEQSRIFERFYRVDRARSRHTGGTGLGLAIVRHAVLNHGGEVNVVSREGFGATFTITLPASSLEVTDAGAPASPAAPLQPADRGADDEQRR